MSEKQEITRNEIEQLYSKLDQEASEAGYNLSTDTDFVLELLEGMQVNQRRYGYQACPCRLSTGVREEDLDIICPCDYRDADLDDYDACYCGLYVSPPIISGEKQLTAIPERRPAPEARKKNKVTRKVSLNKEASFKLPLPVYRCVVCGYLCAREHPPAKCPICKVSKDRFEVFIEASENA